MVVDLVEEMLKKLQETANFMLKINLNSYLNKVDLKETTFLDLFTICEPISKLFEM